MSEHPSRHRSVPAFRWGLYLDAQTSGPGSGRLDALALLPLGICR